LNKDGELPDGVVEAVAPPKRELGLVEGAVSVGLDSACPKTEEPPEPDAVLVPCVVAGFAPNIDPGVEEGSVGFVLPNIFPAGFGGWPAVGNRDVPDIEAAGWVVAAFACELTWLPILPVWFCLFSTCGVDANRDEPL
jgi:hypothetical protein